MTANTLLALPGAPLVLPELTPAVEQLPDELVQLRDAAARVVSSAPVGPVIVVAPTPSLAVWSEGELALAGLGVPDAAGPWSAADRADHVAADLEVVPFSDELPTEARVVARLLGPDRVEAIIGLPPGVGQAACDRLLAIDDVVVAMVGDLSASVGPRSPRPGHEPDLDDLLTAGTVDTGALRALLEGPDAPVAAALQVAAASTAPPLHGTIHVVRGVAALVATSVGGSGSANLVQ